MTPRRVPRSLKVQLFLEGPPAMGSVDGARVHRAVPVPRRAVGSSSAAEYRDDTGEARSVRSYLPSNRPPPGVGDEVVVDYGPDGARIRGMHAKYIGPWVVVVLASLGAFCVGLLFIGIGAAARAARLLRDGVLTSARRVEQTPGLAFGALAEATLTFEYDVEGRTHRCTMRTVSSRLEDDAATPLVYDPASPDEAVALVYLRGAPQIDDGGVIRVRRATWWVPVLAPVTIALLIGAIIRLV